MVPDHSILSTGDKRHKPVQSIQEHGGFLSVPHQHLYSHLVPYGPVEAPVNPKTIYTVVNVSSD